MIESVCLSIAGGIAGLGVATVALRVLAAVAPSTLPRRAEIGIDSAVLVFAAVAALVSGVVFGLLLTLKYSRVRLDSSLGSGSRTVSHGRDRQRARDTLVVVQVALALVLLITSGLMIRTFQAMRRVDPGFTRPEEVRTLRLAIPVGQDRLARCRRPDPASDPGSPRANRRCQRGGVRQLGADGRPVQRRSNPGRRPSGGPRASARTEACTSSRAQASSRRSVPPLVAGRDFTWTDIDERRPVAIVSENVARELWHEPSAALGRRIQKVLRGPWREDRCVVGDIRDDGVQQRPSPSVYWPVLVERFWASRSTRAVPSPTRFARRAPTMV